MSNDEKNSNKSTESLLEDSNEIGEAVKIREFIYLDYPKLTSYYAQMKRGLTRQKSRVRGGGTRDLASTPEEETEVEGGIGAATDDQTPISVTKLLGIMADVEARMRRLSRTGGDEFERTEAEYLIETKELHHDVFAAIESFLTEGGLIETNLALQASKRVFYKVTGQADILDYNDLVSFVKDFDVFRAEFRTVTGNDVGEIANGESLAALLKRFFKDRLGVVIKGNGGTASALLNHDHLTTPVQQLLDNYTRHTYVNFTLFGLKVDQPGWVASPFKAGMAKNLMTSKIVESNRALDKLYAELRLRGDIHIFPIAIYVETHL